eukprot:TRINITY_DN2431_c0_g1_i1.p1 TRINITY_DN2431_c0_g1~~TRINITY_DN2431_c0_g1_i1.p1  ORF type:complete len:1248 (-),score=317.11 TRINITY_DN2431_c0_g1_i1:185-3928(-)
MSENNAYEADSAPLHGGEKIEANKWEQFLCSESIGSKKLPSGCSCCSCWSFFLFGWLWLVIFIIKVSSVGDDILSSDEGSLRSNIHVKNWYAFNAAKKSMGQGCASPEMDTQEVCDADKRCEWIEVKLGKGKVKEICKTKEVCPRPPPKEREMIMSFFMAIYAAEKDGGNLLSDSTMKHIKNFESKLLTTANGAKDKDGNLAPWTDYCWKTYPDGASSNGSETGSCAAVSSPIDIFSLDDAARTKVKAQAEAGYSFAGVMSCMCSSQPGLCAVCNADGTAKGVSPTTLMMDTSPAGLALWPSDVTTCVMQRMNVRRLEELSDVLSRDVEGRRAQAANSSAMCSTGTGMDLTMMGPVLMAFCKDMPDCQWAPPGLSFACSSTSFQHGSDSTHLSSGSEKQGIIDKMFSEDPRYTNYRKAHYDVGFDGPKKPAKYARLTFFAGGEVSIQEADKEIAEMEVNYIGNMGGWLQQVNFLEAEVEQEADGDLRIMLFAQPIIRSQFLNLFRDDMILSILSLVMVWLYMWFQLESMFLASCGIFEIIFSLPVALSLWTVILQQQITFLQMLVLYMILGIGADDVFVLYDAWQQSKVQPENISGSFSTRFAWAYRRAFWAMAVTTSTTCGSFVIGATSPLPQVRDFCIFAAVVVLVDYIFCITFFASAIVVYEKHFVGVACNFGCCCPSICSKFCQVSLREPGRCFGPGMCWGCCRMTCTKGGSCWSLYQAPSDKPEPRSIEKFCTGPLFNFLRGMGGKILVGCWSFLVLLSLILCGAMLRTADQAPPIGRPHIDMTRGLDILLNEFPNFRQPLAYGVWGLHAEEPIKEWGPNHDEDEAALASKGATALTSESGQKQLLAICRAADLGKDSAKKTRCETRDCMVQGTTKNAICPEDKSVWRKSGVYVTEDGLCHNGRYCFMEEYARFWASSYGSCQGEANQASCTAKSDCAWSALDDACYSTKTEFDYPGQPAADFIAGLNGPDFKAYNEKRETVLRSLNRGYDYELAQEMTGYTIQDGKLSFAFIGWNATFGMQNTVEEANEWYDRWEEFYTSNNGDTGGVQTSELHVFMATQNEMVKGAILGIVLSLVVAFLVMLAATRNWWVALIGLGNITSICCVFLGLLPTIGWSLGEYECIFLIATVGLSVDYTAHLLHAYNHALEVTREDRVRSALGEMGISVLNSAITTLAAALMLFGCGFHFFFQFGAFIFIIILLSITMSMTFLMPLMILIGPQGEQGKLKFTKATPIVPEVHTT